MSQNENYSLRRGGFYNNRRPRPKNTQQQQQQPQGTENIETKPPENMSHIRTKCKPETQQIGKSFITKMEVTNKSAKVFNDVFQKEVLASSHLKFIRNSEAINNFDDEHYDDDSSSLYSSTYDILSQPGGTFSELSQASCSDYLYNLSQQDYSSTRKSRQIPRTKSSFIPQFYPKCAIFWDIENCRLPSGKSTVLHFVKSVRDTFCKDHTEDKFLVVCDTTKLAAGVISDLQDSLVKLEHVSGTSKNAADECLRRNMREFAENNVAPSKIVIITGDINFNSELHDMKYKRHFNVILIHNRQTSEALKALASECHEFEEFCMNLPELRANKNTGSVEVIVNNLPNNVERKKVHRKLHRMVKVFGGKILNINDSSNTGIVQFSSRNDALIAQSFLRGQDIQGSKITLDVITNSTEKNNTDDDKKSEKKINENKNKRKEESIQNSEDEQNRNSSYVSICLNESMYFSQLQTEAKKQQLYDIQLLRNESDVGILKTSIIKENTSLKTSTIKENTDLKISTIKENTSLKTCTIKENTVVQNCVRIQQCYLDKHKTKMMALRTRLSDLEKNRFLNPSIVNEIFVLQKRYNILLDIEKEFEQATNGILDSLKNGSKVNDPESKILFEALQLARACPIYPYRRKIIKSFTVNPVTVLAGLAGCGKSTQVAQYIFQEMITNKCKIVSTQPHKSLVTKVRSTVASQMRNSIGYKLTMGNDQKLLYVTEHSLFLKCFSNNLLDDITYILIDEAQERNIFTEFLLAYFKMILPKRKDLHLLVMTTPDCAESFSNFFNKCEIIKIDYANYPVEIIWEVPNQNYVNSAVAKVLDILQLKENGDILVFLPNASDVNYASHVTAKKLGTLTAVNIYKLLLSYNFEQTYKNIQESSSRKIIFTTGDEEKIISLSNIKFVVDSGFITKYRCEINHKFVETKFITSSSAAFRASAAGVNSPGKCYRLYSPETLASVGDESTSKLNIDLLLLCILSLGINPNSFNYFSPIPEEKICESLKKLEKINAIEKNVITSKGRQLIQLPLDIHLSNILLEGIERKIRYETLCFVAVSSTMHMYTVLTTETSNTKMKNVMELVKDYMEWYGKNLVNRENFLTEIKINVRDTMKIINEKIIELYSVLKKSFPSFRLQSTNSDWEFQLEKLISICWLDNLCILRRDNVYLWNLCQTPISLLPSLASEDDFPKYLIFETLWKMRSGEYSITNIVPLDENVIENDENIWMVNIIKKMIQQDVTIIRPVGHYILKTGFVDSNGDLKVILEKKLSQLVGSIVNIEVFQNKGEIKIYCGQRNKDKVRDEIGKTIDKIQNKMEMELWEFSICKQTGMRIVWSKMADVVQFLMPSDFMSVIVLAPTTTSTDKILRSFHKYGQIVHHSEKIIITNQKQINIMFDNPTSAKHALEHKEKGLTTKPQLVNVSQRNESQYFVELKIHWTRRLNLGIAVIQFDKFPSFIHQKITCFPDVMKEYNEQGRRLVLKNLDRTLSKEEIVSKIKADLIDTDIRIEFSHFSFQEPGFQSSLEDLNAIKSKLRSLVTPLFGENDVEILVEEPNLYDDFWTATVTSKIFQKSHLSINSIFNKTLDGLPLRVTVNYSYCVFCGRDLFHTVKNGFQVELEKRRTIVEKKNCNMQVQTTTEENNGKIAVEIVGDDLGEVILWYQCLAQRLRSYTFNVSDYELLTEKFSADDERNEILNKFAKNANTFVGYNKFSNQISVVDNAEVIENLRSQLQLEIANSEFLDEAVFNCNSPGTIRELVKLYDPKLSVLKKITGAFHVELNITSKNIKVKGDDEAVNEIEEKLKSIAMKLKTIKASDIKNDPIEICPICSDDVDNADSNYRMEMCGHAYCFPCVTAFIANKEPPISCLFQGCSKPIVYRDLSNLHQECPSVVRNLADKTTFRYLERNMAAFLFCVLPDCDGILSRSDKENYCVKCFNKICIRCEVLYHFGETCEEYKKKYPKTIIQKSQVEFNAKHSTLSTKVTAEKPKETNSFEIIRPISRSKSKLAIVFPTFSPEDSTTEAPLEKNTFIKSNTKPLSDDPDLLSSSIFTRENSNSSLKSTHENNSQIEKQTAPKKLPPVDELVNSLTTGVKTPKSIPSLADCSNRPQPQVYELDKTLSTGDKTPQPTPSFVGISNRQQPPVYELSNSLSTGGETPQFTSSVPDWSSRRLPPPVCELGNSLNTGDKTPQPVPSFASSGNRPTSSTGFLSSSSSGVGYSRSNEASRTPGINSTSYSSNERSPSGNSYYANSTRVNYSNQRSDPNQFCKPQPPKNDDKCTTM